MSVATTRRSRWLAKQPPRGSCSVICSNHRSSPPLFPCYRYGGDIHGQQCGWDKRACGCRGNYQVGWRTVEIMLFMRGVVASGGLREGSCRECRMAFVALLLLDADRKLQAFPSTQRWFTVARRPLFIPVVPIQLHLHDHQQWICCSGGDNSHGQWHECRCVKKKQLVYISR